MIARLDARTYGAVPLVILPRTCPSSMYLSTGLSTRSNQARFSLATGTSHSGRLTRSYHLRHLTITHEHGLIGRAARSKSTHLPSKLARACGGLHASKPYCNSRDRGRRLWSSATGYSVLVAVPGTQPANVHESMLPSEPGHAVQRAAPPPPQFISTISSGHGNPTCFVFPPRSEVRMRKHESTSPLAISVIPCQSTRLLPLFLLPRIPSTASESFAWDSIPAQYFGTIFNFQLPTWPCYMASD